MTAPHMSIEIERKYDVDADTPLPDWSALPGVASVGAPEPRSLDARYFDDAESSLANGGMALRRRTGGQDAGWHIKIADFDGKHELRWPLGDGPADVVPDDVLSTAEKLAEPPFRQIARIRNERVAYALTDAAGGLVAEFVDDHVEAEASATGATSTWREWELELGPAAPTDPAGIEDLFIAADLLVFAVGGAVAASPSKIGRALGA
ncbi:MAG TPA: CYTH domain-containing protein [Microbacterium sp.]|nr:CYTH domain-containing protein [Microbacterium sp.]